MTQGNPWGKKVENGSIFFIKSESWLVKKIFFSQIFSTKLKQHLLKIPLPMQQWSKWQNSSRAGIAQKMTFSGHPKISTNDEQVDAIHYMVFNDICLTVQQIAKYIGIGSSSVHTVWTKILGG